jgi:hypothetical protein
MYLFIKDSESGGINFSSPKENLPLNFFSIDKNFDYYVKLSLFVFYCLKPMHESAPNFFFQDYSFLSFFGSVGNVSLLFSGTLKALQTKKRADVKKHNL